MKPDTVHRPAYRLSVEFKDIAVHMASDGSAMIDRDLVGGRVGTHRRAGPSS